MQTMADTFEAEIDAAARSARRRTLRYDEEASQPISQLQAKSLLGKIWLCQVLQEGGV